MLLKTCIHEISITRVSTRDRTDTRLYTSRHAFSVGGKALGSIPTIGHLAGHNALALSLLVELIVRLRAPSSVAAVSTCVMGRRGSLVARGGGHALAARGSHVCRSLAVDLLVVESAWVRGHRVVLSLLWCAKTRGESEVTSAIGVTWSDHAGHAIDDSYIYDSTQPYLLPYMVQP